MFRATVNEAKGLRSQIATLESGRGQHRKYTPNLFTEHGALMLASVLNSARAVEVSVMIVEAFVQMRHMASVHSELADRVDELERRLGKHDSEIAALLLAIRRLGHVAASKPRPIGFTADLGEVDKK
jgi:hypothetical protein